MAINRFKSRLWEYLELAIGQRYSAFVVLESLPLTSNGKLDRRALPKPVALQGKKGSVPPRDALGTQLVEIWEKALGLQPIGITDNFFEMGAYEIARRLRRAGEEVASLVLFDTANRAKPARVRSWKKIVADKIWRVASQGTTPSRIFQFWAQQVRGELGDNLLRWNERFHKPALGRGAARHGNPAAELRSLHVQMVHERAHLAYKPLAYRGKVTLFRTLNQDSAYEVDQDLRWSAVARGGVEVHFVPGIHDTIFEDENVPYLARKVDECIRPILPKSK